MNNIVEYYTAEGEDHSGRTWVQTLMLSDRKLERTHDYIQWLFPLNVPSAFCKDAPVLTEEDIQALRSHPEVPVRLLQSVERMLRFYGNTSHWREPRDHNHLRITRILKCLVLLGQQHMADDFYDWLVSLEDCEVVFQAALPYWQEACGRSALCESL